MNLKYKILWFDNDIDWIKSIESQVEELVEDLGFVYESTLQNNGAKIDSIRLDNYDIILMDLNLEDEASGNGDQLIEKIRSFDVYTDVLFYSADGLTKIKEKAQAMGLEGVYFSGRNQTTFIPKLKKVINTTINKIQDLNNLRGLVMAEVSELDGIMVDLINKYYVQNETDEIKEIFHNHITKKQEERLKTDLEGCEKKEMICCHKWKNMSISDIIPKLEAAQLAKAVSYIVPKELYTPSRANFFEDYKAEILDIRNDLAHCKSEMREGQEILLTRKGDKCFDETFFKEIRKNILKYSRIFNELLQ